ncbi:MAG: ribosome maturation factor RimM [bacterium]|jgi:16S rRNA processing protein RimM|nr:ribosome maturation factor RimM [bacterium]
MTILRRKKNIPDDRIYLGKITKSHALLGEVKFQPFGSDPWLLQQVQTVYCEEPLLILEVEYVRGTEKAPIVKFKSVNDRTASDQLAGRLVWIKEEALPELEPGFVYESQILQCRVISIAGDELGTVEDVLETGEFDVLVVRGKDRQEWMIPANHEVVKSIDWAKKEILVDPPAGLFESQTLPGTPAE